MSDWLYNTSSLEVDKNAAKLFKTDGTYKDSNKTERYVKGVSDIAQRYAQEIESRSVLVCLSHSDGINEFLSAFKCKTKIKNPCHCATIAVEIEKDSADGFKVLNVDVLQA